MVVGMLFEEKQDSSIEDFPFTPEFITESILGFKYDEQDNLTIDAYFQQFQDIFEKECSKLSDKKKARLLLRKLGTVEHKNIVITSCLIDHWKYCLKVP